MNLRPKDGRPIQGGSEFQVETDLAAIAEEIAGIIGHTVEISKSEGYIPLGPEKISLAQTTLQQYLYIKRNYLKLET